ncbi:FAS1-like dehydratase domain-containing protein [Dactylosporangium sp. CS-033363]|uniref:FAS1-like dehydratase domain-containing protein n=1 Tax=Dactylosporangium sp. CS-033363 TaxID=3239935 RepID=UPI003D8D2D26
MGEPLASLELVVDAVKVRELAHALRADPAVVPPTYSVVAAFSGRSPNEYIIAAAGLDQRRVLLGEMAWTFFHEVRLGQVLHGTVELLSRTSRTGRRGGTMVLAHGVTTWRDASGSVVQRCEATLIEPAASASRAAVVADISNNSDGLRLSRTDIVRYAGAAGDFNPVHHDEPYAAGLGYPSVFAMGLLPGGILAAEAVALLSPAAAGRVAIRFGGITWPDVPYRRRVLDLPDGGVELSLLAPDGSQVVRVQAVPRGSEGS